MPTTPVYQFPFPALTDTPDVPRDMQALALKVEGALAPPASTLPGTPYDGQVAHYKVTANGPVWTFVYVAGSTAPRWHFIGGAPLCAFVGAIETNPNNGVWMDLTTVGPSITLPALAGEYIIDHGCLSYQNTGGTAMMAYAVGATAPVDTWAVINQPGGVNLQQTNTRRHLHTGVAAGAAIVAKYYGAGGGPFFGRRFLMVTPSRVS